MKHLHVKELCAICTNNTVVLNVLVSFLLKEIVMLEKQSLSEFYFEKEVT